MAAPRPSVLVPIGEADGRERWVVEHEDAAYLVLVVDGTPLVMDALCPHSRLPLVDGLVRRGAIVCPEHWYSFELGTGRCRTTTQLELRHYPVVDVDGASYARVPTGPVPSWSERLRAHAEGGS